MRAIVCGGRDFLDREFVFQELDRIHSLTPFSLIIEGAARGADTLAGDWAESRGVPLQEFPAKWQKHGRRAGFIRNAQMLEEGLPDVVIAFDGGNGTANMKRISKEAKVQVIELTKGVLDG